MLKPQSTCKGLMLIGKILKQRYEIIKAIGSGAFGNTYIAVDRDFPGLPHRVVKHLCPIHTDPASLVIAKKLFAREAECLSKLGEYSQIPRLFSYFEEDNEFYLVQELIKGHDLTHEFQPGKKWSESETVDFLRELLSILSVVHQNNTIHRDIKPANIMRRGEDGKLVLIDFGAVKEVLTVDKKGETTTIINSTVAIGTQPYMSAEQAIGKPKKCSDIYAVGMLGVQALTGLASKDLFLDSEGLRRIWQDLGIEISPKLKSILECMIRFQPKQRYADAKSALEAIAFENSDTPVAEPSPDPSTNSTENPEEVTSTEWGTTVTTVSNPSQPEAEPVIITKSFPKKLLFGAIAAVALTGGVGVYLAQALNKPDYTQLETYLENKQWEQADLETDKIILGIARESSELGTESIDKFPCKSLEKLDELWTTNSNGKFGFTPQKEAYLATGNEFNSYAEGTYEAFGDRIGWITQMFANSDNFWNVYGNLKLEDENKAPAGHLPSPGLEADGQNIRHRERGKLLSRFNECGI